MEETNWIEVTERLPEIGIIVLCSCISWHRRRIFREERLLHFRGKWRGFGGGDNPYFEDQAFMSTIYKASSQVPARWDAGNVTHWMPIPAIQIKKGAEHETQCPR